MYERINSGPGMGTQEVRRIATPMLMVHDRDEPFTLEQSGPSWWVWGGLAVLILGGAAGAGYWFWYRPRQTEQDAEEV